MQHQECLFVVHNGGPPRLRAGLDHLVFGLAHAFPSHHMQEGRQPHGRDQAEDGHDHHHLNQGEAARKPRHHSPALLRPIPTLAAQLHRTEICEVMAKRAESTPMSRKPTPTAMTQIMTGSIMLVMTRNARSNLPSDRKSVV